MSEKSIYDLILERKKQHTKPLHETDTMADDKRRARFVPTIREIKRQLYLGCTMFVLYHNPDHDDKIWKAQILKLVPYDSMYYRRFWRSPDNTEWVNQQIGETEKLSPWVHAGFFSNEEDAIKFFGKMREAGIA